MAKTGLPKSEGNNIDQNKIKTAQKAETLHLEQEAQRDALEKKLNRSGLLHSDAEWLEAIRQQDNEHRDAMARVRRGEK